MLPTKEVLPKPLSEYCRMHFNDQRNFVETDNNHFHCTDQKFASGQSIFLGTDKFSFILSIEEMLPKLIVFIFFKTGNNCFLFTDQSIFVKTDNNYCNFTDQRNCLYLTIIISILPNKVFLLKLIIIISDLLPTKASLLKLIIITAILPTNL